MTYRFEFKVREHKATHPNCLAVDSGQTKGRHLLNAELICGIHSHIPPSLCWQGFPGPPGWSLIRDARLDRLLFWSSRALTLVNVSLTFTGRLLSHTIGPPRIILPMLTDKQQHYKGSDKGLSQYLQLQNLFIFFKSCPSTICQLPTFCHVLAWSRNSRRLSS